MNFEVLGAKCLPVTKPHDDVDLIAGSSSIGGRRQSTSKVAPGTETCSSSHAKRLHPYKGRHVLPMERINLSAVVVILVLVVIASGQSGPVRDSSWFEGF